MRYIVFGNYINPWTTARGLKRLGLQVDCIAPEGGLLQPTLNTPSSGDVLFFAEEDSLLRFLNSPQSSEYHFYPREIAILPDDKLAFSRFLCSIDEQPVPFWDIDTDPEVEALYPLVLKARHSWLEGKKLTRGYVCNNRTELTSALKQMEVEGLPMERFFLQKFISCPVEANLSTCGFFDYRNSRRNLIITTRKRLGDGGLLNTGAIVETVSDPACLTQRTERILSALQYRGPFELEFLYDTQSNTYYALELNMRFWMQHGLFIEGCDNRLLKFYLDLDTPNDWLECGMAYEPMIWLDSVYLWRALFTLRFGALRRYAGAFMRGLSGQSKVYLYPSAGIALAFLIRRASKRLFRRGGAR